MFCLRSWAMFGAWWVGVGAVLGDEPLAVGAMERPPVLDGDLADWPRSTAILLGEARHTLPRPGQWEGTTDLSGVVRLAWDRDWLYVAAEVADDQLMQAGATGAEPWQGDSLELFFNAEPGRQDTPCFRQIALVPNLSGETGLAVHCPQGEFPGVEGRAKAHAKGYTLECRIPWKNLWPFRPEEGAALGFQVMLDDRDKKGRKSQLCWYPSAVTYSRPREMGVLRLGNVPSDRGDRLAVGPRAAMVTAADKTEFSVATIEPHAESVRLSVRGEADTGTIFVPLETAAGELKVGKGTFARPDLEGAVSFRAEILNAAQEPIAAREFTADLAGGRYAKMRTALAQAEARLAALPAPDSEAGREQRAGVAFWLQRAKALAANEARPESVRPAMLEDLLGELAEIDGAIGDLEKGADPYANRTGSFVRAYRSPLTGDFRPHALIVPKNLPSAASKPLIVVLHGIFADERQLFQMAPDLRGIEAIVYQAASYRQLDWSDLSAAETWAGLEQVLQGYPIDRSRISLMGHHIGGRGVLQLAMARPGFFSAAAALYPGIDARPPYPALRLYPQFYARAVENHIPFPVFKKPEPLAALSDGLEKEVLRKLSLATRAENLSGLPLRIARGEDDPDAAAEELALLERCRRMGWQISVTYEPGAMHGSRPPALDGPELYRWLIAARREPAPGEFEFVCTSLRDHTGWFVRVDALESPVAPGRITFSRQDDRLVYTTNGVSAFTPLLEALSPAQVGLQIDGQDVGAWEGGKLAGRTFRKDAEGKWGEGPLTAGNKRHGLSGPIDDFQRGTLLYVYGTLGSPEETALLEKIAKKISHRGLGTEFPYKPDRDVSEEEMRTRHLVLIGSPSSHSLLKRWESEVPLKWDGEGYRLGEGRVTGPGTGACVIIPNPQMEGRYMVVLTARDESGYRVWDARTGVDYVLGKSDGKRFSPRLKGLFGNDWKFHPELAFLPHNEP